MLVVARPISGLPALGRSAAVTSAANVGLAASSEPRTLARPGAAFAVVPV